MQDNFIPEINSNTTLKLNSKNDFHLRLIQEISDITRSKENHRASFATVPKPVNIYTKALNPPQKQDEEARRYRWRPVSPLNSGSIGGEIVDSSPSTCFQKNSLLMGIYNSACIKPPHMEGVGKWRGVDHKRRFFENPPRMNWASEWSYGKQDVWTPQRVREEYLGRGRRPSHSVI